MSLKYDYVFRPDDDHAGAHVLKLVPKGAKVLETGAGAGSITRPLVELNQCKMTALEVDPSYEERLRSLCDRVVFSDLNQIGWSERAFQSERFDAVVIADVLEHLIDPDNTLKEVVGLITEGGSIVMSIPHVANNAIIACLLTGDFDYREYGLLDRTHVRFFAIDNVERLVDQAGLKIVDARFVIKPPKRTEFAKRWSALSVFLRRDLDRTNPYGTIYQFVIRAVPVASPEPKIDLRSRARTENAKRGRAFISPRTRRRVMKMVGLQ